jgi:hypothetical protein
LRHRFAKIEEIDDLRFEITAVTFSEGCFHAAYSLISWSNILAHLKAGLHFLGTSCEEEETTLLR